MLMIIKRFYNLLKSLLILPWLSKTNAAPTSQYVSLNNFIQTELMQIIISLKEGKQE